MFNHNVLIPSSDGETSEAIDLSGGEADAVLTKTTGDDNDYDWKLPLVAEADAAKNYLANMSSLPLWLFYMDNFNDQDVVDVGDSASVVSSTSGLSSADGIFPNTNAPHNAVDFGASGISNASGSNQSYNQVVLLDVMLPTIPTGNSYFNYWSTSRAINIGLVDDALYIKCTSDSMSRDTGFRLEANTPYSIILYMTSAVGTGANRHYDIIVNGAIVDSFDVVDSSSYLYTKSGISPSNMQPVIDTYAIWMNGDIPTLAECLGYYEKLLTPTDARSDTLPKGGTTGQKLVKASGDDHDTSWVDDEEVDFTISGVGTDDNTMAVGSTNSVFVGHSATSIGHLAGENVVDGDHWTAIGNEAGSANITGDYWTAIGSEAGKTATSNNWTAVGRRAGYKCTGMNFTAVGYGTGANATSAHSWTAVGNVALPAMTTGIKNTGIGVMAYLNLTTGANNTSLGYYSGKGIVTGSNNTILGAGVIDLPSDLSDNIILSTGDGAGIPEFADNAAALTAGLVNGKSIYRTPSGALKVADDAPEADAGGVTTLINGGNATNMGVNSTNNSHTGDNCTAFGYLSAEAETTGNNWVALGSRAGTTANGKSNWTAIGCDSGRYAAGNNWTALGYKAGSKCTSNDWVALGYASASNATTAFGWVAIGSGAMNNLTSGTFSIGIGKSALYNLTTGTSNTAVGYSTGLGITTGINNTILGASVGSLPTDLSNNIILSSGDGTGIPKKSTNAAALLDSVQDKSVYADDQGVLRTPVAAGGAIHTKIVTGTTAAAVGNHASVAHGLDSSKIISITGNVTYDTGKGVAPGYVVAGRSYGVAFDTVNTWCMLGDSASGLLSKPFTIIITYSS